MNFQPNTLIQTVIGFQLINMRKNNINHCRVCEIEIMCNEEKIRNAKGKIINSFSKKGVKFQAAWFCNKCWSDILKETAINKQNSPKPY